ncbi:YqhA family protein, partial [Vibrio parahaemolyticus]|nr:YqhA family protein [Vibrio parahaemolyticus]
GHLKNILAEVIIVILFVKFLELVLINFDSLDWTILTLPISILVLSLGLKFLGLGATKHSEEH